MPLRIILSACFVCAASILCAQAVADDKITLHENLHAGQKVSYSIDSDTKNQMTSTMRGWPTITNTDSHQVWKNSMTMLEIKDGSATRAQVNFDPTSYDITRSLGATEQKTACPFIGKGVIVSRNPDESLTNDFAENAPSDDVGLLNSCITPDEDFFPDTPVSAGDVWDNTVKYARHCGLGPNDQFTSRCRLDWVKIINGKQMAQITANVAIIYHENCNVEEDMGSTMVELVDVAAGMAVKCDETGSSKYSTPPSEPTQVTGGETMIFHAQVIPNPAPTASTQP
jgi:hypothetical protein